MPSDLKFLNGTEKIKLAEKHLDKFLLEIKRHFDFSDFQIIHLLDKSSSNIRKNYKLNMLNKLFIFIKKNK